MRWLAFKQISPVFVLTMTASLANGAEYVPGVTCPEVGGFAGAVVREKRMGNSLAEQINGMRQSIPDCPKAQVALEAIIRAIYAGGALSHGEPDQVAEAYEKSCRLVEGR